MGAKQPHSGIFGKLSCKLLALALLTLQPHMLPAQSKKSSAIGSDSLVFPTDNRVQKRFQDAKDYFAQQQWTQGLEILDRTVELFPDVMVALGTRRYVSVFAYRNLLVADIPAQGLVAYRQRVDAETELLLQVARKFRDPNPLRSILRKSFASSHGDEALELLGSLAWDKGEFATAKFYWNQILPSPNIASTNTVDRQLSYPDSNLNLPEIRARCVLCSMMLKNWQRATLELDAFQKKYPQTEGYLAGSKGILSENLVSISKRLKTQNSFPTFETNATFAGNPNRNRTYRFQNELKSASWSKPFGQTNAPLAVPIDSPIRQQPLIHFPTVHAKTVFFCDSYRIWAVDLLTGKPAWGNGGSENSNSNHGIIFQSPEFRANLKPDTQSSGDPLHSLTISQGKLFARMGNPITNWSSSDLRVKPSSIICLDIEQGEGRLLWSRSSREFAGKWSFVGTPLLVNGEVFQILQQSHPQKQTYLVCMDSLSGKTRWMRKTYSTISAGNSAQNRIAPNLLTFGNGRLYLSTERGGVIAIDAETGSTDWIITYRSEDYRLPKEIVRASIVNPPLFYRDRIYLAPLDANAVFCIEASSGILLWKRSFSDRIEHLLAATESGLLVSGKHLWCLDGESGKLNWNGPIFTNPSGHGFGRGFVSEQHVYWPTRNRIYQLDLQTGTLASPPLILNIRNSKATGGNLIPTSQGLLIAEPDRLVFYPHSK